MQPAMIVLAVMGVVTVFAARLAEIGGTAMAAQFTSVLGAVILLAAGAFIGRGALG